MKDARLGLVKTTLVDYPGEVAATLFTHGCNLRCPYCHNPELVVGPGPEDLRPVDEILTFLSQRRRVLTGVCITGGEPLVHPWLPDLAVRIHDLGMKVKLDTNGLLPDNIAGVNADYVAMDIKTAPRNYGRVAAGPTQQPGKVGDISRRVRESISVVRSTVPEYEFRTTVLHPIVTEDDIREIVALLQHGDRYTITAFRPGKTLDPALSDASPPNGTYLTRLADIARAAGLDVTVRENRV